MFSSSLNNPVRRVLIARLYTRLSPLTTIKQGADSVQPTIGWIFLLLAHRGDIQKRAFEEFKNVVKDGYSLHETQDVEYILLLVKEALRFYSPLPLSMPRESTTELHYKGTIIPKGTMVFLNAWACNHGMRRIFTSV